MTIPDFQGRTILITRPQPEAEATAQQVRAYHGQPLLAPSLTILPPHDQAPLQAALHHLDEYDGILLTSANGARALIAALTPEQSPPPLFAVGQQTASILQKQGWQVHIPSQAAGGVALAQAVMTWKNQSSRLLFPQAEQGREELGTLLQQAGYRVERVVAYRAEPMTNLPDIVRQALAAGEVAATLFFSGRSAQAFVATLPPPNGTAWLRKTIIAAISPVTAQTIQQLGYNTTVVATEPSSTALLTALHHYWSP